MHLYFFTLVFIVILFLIYKNQYILEYYKYKFSYSPLKVSDRSIRLSNYLGNLNNINYLQIKNPHQDLIVTCNRKEFQEWYNICPKSNTYLYQDTIIPTSFPIITPHRPIKNIGYNVLLPFDDIETFEDTLKFKDKVSDVVWRGSNTGGSKRIGIEKWYKQYNLGFTKINSKTYKGTRNIDKLNDMKKDKLTTKQHLHYKYILALEGKGSPKNLKQYLFSNSLCIIPYKLTMESWLLESNLKPWIHYLPVKNNLSDLKQKINWIKKNNSIAIKIIKNANNYVKEFNKVNNRELSKTILETFAKKVDISSE